MKQEKQNNENVRVTRKTTLDAAMPSKRKDARHEGTREEASTKKKESAARGAPSRYHKMFPGLHSPEGSCPERSGQRTVCNAVAGAIRIVVTVWVTTVATLLSWSRVP